MTIPIKLFAVYLGGRAPKGNTELHDVVFVTGKAIEDTYVQLLDKWFGAPKGLHLDSWMELDVVDGHRISLGPSKVQSGRQLYFVNLGAYRDGEFSEIHANKFLVAGSVAEAKSRGKAELLAGWPGRVHTDDVYEVDDCIELGKVDGWHVVLTPTGEASTLQPHNGYHIIPKAVIEEYMNRRRLDERGTFREAYESTPA